MASESTGDPPYQTGTSSVPHKVLGAISERNSFASKMQQLWRDGLIQPKNDLDSRETRDSKDNMNFLGKIKAGNIPGSFPRQNADGSASMTSDASLDSKMEGHVAEMDSRARKLLPENLIEDEKENISRADINLNQKIWLYKTLGGTDDARPENLPASLDPHQRLQSMRLTENFGDFTINDRENDFVVPPSDMDEFPYSDPLASSWFCNHLERVPSHLREQAPRSSRFNHGAAHKYGLQSSNNPNKVKFGNPLNMQSDPSAYSFLEQEQPVSFAKMNHSMPSDSSDPRSGTSHYAKTNSNSMSSWGGDTVQFEKKMWATGFANTQGVEHINSAYMVPSARMAPFQHVGQTVDKEIVGSTGYCRGTGGNIGTSGYQQYSVMSHEQIIDCILANNDQSASLFLQQRLKSMDRVEIDKIIAAITAQCLSLMTNRFGNFAVQKALECCTPEQTKAIVAAMKDNVVSLSTNRFGSHVVQKVLELVDEPCKVDLAHELLQQIPESICHKSASHVWQRLFETRWSIQSPQIMDHVNQALKGEWGSIAQSETGSLICQNVFENCLEPDKRMCLEEVLASAGEIARGQYGNWVISHIIENGSPEDSARAISIMIEGAVSFSFDPYATKVLEKLIRDEVQMQAYVDKILEKPPTRPRASVVDISGDIHGNYLIQYILQYGPPTIRDKVAQVIRRHMVSLRGSKHGQRVAFMVERLKAYPVQSSKSSSTAQK